MEELNRKWFKIVWALLLFASLTIDYIQRMSDALWAHGPVVEMLDKILFWIMLPMTLLLFVLYWIGNWRTGERYFWKKLRTQAGAMFIGGGLGFLLVLVVQWCKGDAVEMSSMARATVLAIFSVVGLMIGYARYRLRKMNEE